jgi:hypothetical protein
MGFATFECKKHQRKADGIQVTTWVSTEYHPLVVKRVTFESASTSVHRLTAFQTATVDPWMLYRKEGRRWKTKSTISAGGRPTNSYIEYSVKDVRDDSATYSMAVLDANGKAMFTQDQEMKFTMPSVASPAGRAPQTTMESKKVEAGEFQCNLMDQNGTKSWTSVQWPLLVVAMETNSFTMELIEFDIGHDSNKFFRTVGNYLVLTRTRTIGNQVAVETLRFDVTAVNETEATVKATTTMERGEPGVSEFKEPFTEPPETTVYAAEVEEWIETPAGKFAAVKKVADGGTSWTWNGLVVKRESTADGVTSVSELTELNLE